MSKVRSVVTGDNAQLLAQVARIWIRPEDRVMDVTWGRGLWWTEFCPPDLIRHDKYKLDGVDFRVLPEDDGSIDVVAFDPAYVTPGGRKTSTLADRGSDMWDRYGMDTEAKNPDENRVIIAAGIKEAARVLRLPTSGADGIYPPPTKKPRRRPWVPGGRLLVKAMDYVWSGHLQPGTNWVKEAAAEAGLRWVDQFVHVGGPGPQPSLNPDGTTRRQVHAESCHSVLLVFQVERRRS